MSARNRRGNAVRQRVSATHQRAAAVEVVESGIPPRAARARAQAPARPRGVVPAQSQNLRTAQAPAPQRPHPTASQTPPASRCRQPSERQPAIGAEAGKASMAEGHPEGARSVQPARVALPPRSSQPDLPNPEGAPTMSRTAPSFFYDQPKSVPLGGFGHSSPENSKEGCKPLILRSYTLCEVLLRQEAIRLASCSHTLAANRGAW